MQFGIGDVFDGRFLQSVPTPFGALRISIGYEE
jgi:hypothetical protein